MREASGRDFVTRPRVSSVSNAAPAAFFLEQDTVNRGRMGG